jgi:putative GTP pyrophosphokinase
MYLNGPAPALEKRKTREVPMESTIYGNQRPNLEKVMGYVTDRIQDYSRQRREETGEAAYEHLIYRIKSEDSMREKCVRKGLPETPESALVTIHDSIGIRIVCCFLDDIYDIIEYIKSIPGCHVFNEKDYIRNAKPNGYRSYHLILEMEMPLEDVLGRNPGHFFVEIQLRTIAMDSWASLEHQMKYKHEVANQAMIVRELKRCADELASCDVSMQTIRNLIRGAK